MFELTYRWSDVSGEGAFRPSARRHLDEMFASNPTSTVDYLMDLVADAGALLEEYKEQGEELYRSRKNAQ